MIAFWMIAYGYLQFAAAGINTWMLYTSMGNQIAAHPAPIIATLAFTLVYVLAMVQAGKWIRLGEPRGHYLGIALFALPALFAPFRGAGYGLVVVIGFMVLLVMDIRKLRSDPAYTLTVPGYRLLDFWMMPWLVSSLALAVGGYGFLSIPAIVTHLVSPLVVGYIHVRLSKHPQVSREPRTDWYYLSLAVWVLCYAASVAWAYLVIGGLAGLAMQGAGK